MSKQLVAGLCNDCYEVSNTYRCTPCKEKRRLAKNTGKYACSYCQQPGHTKTVCKVHKVDLKRIAKIDAWLEQNAKLLADEAEAHRARKALKRATRKA